MKLKNRIALSYGIIMLIIVTAVSALIYVGTGYMIKRIVSDAAANTTKEAGYILDDYIYEVEDITSLVFSNPDVSKYNHNMAVKGTLETLKEEEKITDFLNGLGIYKNYSDFAIFYSDGDYLGQISSTSEDLFKDQNIYRKLTSILGSDDEKWFTGYKGNYKRHYYTKRLNEGAIILTSFFYRELDKVTEVARDKDDLAATIVYSGVNIYSTDSDTVGTAADEILLKKIASDPTGSFEYNNLIVSYYKCTNDWLLITLTSEKQLNTILRYIGQIAAIIVLCGFGVVVVLGLLIANSVTKPIANMAAAINKIQDGDFDAEIPDGSTLEIHTLSTGLKAMVKSVRENIEAADRANREKSKFLANTSHEIRTPMNAIIGYADMLIEESEEEKTMERATTIRGAAKNLLSIVNDILDFSKIEAGKIELKEDDYHIANVLDEVSGIIRIPAMQKNLDFSATLLNRFPAVLHGDDIKIRQILINLANNAIKFTNEGHVHITGKCEKVQGDDSTVKMVFAVNDTGIGIKPEDISKVFGAFEQVDAKNNRKKEGSGLGLSIAKEFAKMMGGDITVESEYGRGTVFTVTVYNKVVAWEAEKESPIDVRGKKLLVVDDNETNLVIFKNMLAPYEVLVDTALSGTEVLENDHLTDYDLIFMDHLMPDMGGDEVTREIRARKEENPKYEKIPIVGYTADTDGDAQKLMIGAGMDDCVVKPVSVQKLEALFRKFLMCVIVLFVFTSSGCGEKEQENFIPYLDEEIQVSFSWWGDDETHDYTLGLIERFEKENVRIKINPSYAEKGAYGDRVRAMFNSGKEADVMQIDYSWLGTYSSNGKGFYNLENSGNIIDLSEYDREVLNYGRIGGVLNAVTVAVDMDFIIVNEDILRRYDLPYPDSWENLEKIGIKLRPAGNYALVVNDTEQLVNLLQAYMEQNVGFSIFDENGKLQYTHAGFATMLEMYKTMINDHVMRPLGEGSTNEWMLERSPLTMGSITEMERLTDSFPEEASLSVCTMPIGYGMKTNGLHIKPSSMYAISDTAKDPVRASELMNFILQDMNTSTSAGLSKGAPVSKSAVKAVKADTDNTSLAHEAALLLYETDYTLQSSRLCSEENLSLFEEVFTKVGFGEITVEEGAEMLAAGIR